MDTIVIHQSDSSFGTAGLIDRWHKERGWSGIGYHRVILNGWLREGTFRAECDGLIQAGRALDEIGAHVRGHNETSIGICLIGVGPGWPVRLESSASSGQIGGAGAGYLTHAEWRALVWLCRKFVVEFGVAVERVLGHREFPGVTKTCPGFDVAELRCALRGKR
ncbi:MAG: N-acetylmuramoyl-L-alanine amidase [Armatimonadota bacterium]|nr:MAG: N-acetylmuramoyl-L-alanine amidase [Armatimonadota bacterium]